MTWPGRRRWGRTSATYTPWSSGNGRRICHQGSKSISVVEKTDKEKVDGTYDPVGRSQVRMAPSWLDETSQRASGLKATSVRRPSWPASRRTTRPVSSSTTATLRSSRATASRPLRSERRHRQRLLECSAVECSFQYYPNSGPFHNRNLAQLKTLPIYRVPYERTTCRSHHLPEINFVSSS